MSIVQTPTTAANFADQASAYALAIRVLAPRFRQLTREDKADFAALAAEFASADTEEEQLETIKAMMEVLDGPVGTIAFRPGTAHEAARRLRQMGQVDQ